MAPLDSPPILSYADEIGNVKCSVSANPVAILLRRGGGGGVGGGGGGGGALENNNGNVE